jgi:hypothetical protein
MTTTNFIISRSAVEANPKIRLVDSDPTNNNISLFCYDTCDDNDDELVKSCRGIAFSGEELIFKGFPYTYEYTQKKNHDAINNLLSNNLCSIYDSFEGTLLRMFCYNNKWYLSTNRKLDANKSKWGSKTTFGEYFKQALEYEVVVSIKFREAIFREREGGDITAATAGLPCALCHSPTRSTLSYQYTCMQCNYTTEEKFPLGKTTEEPMYCDSCNP